MLELKEYKIEELKKYFQTTSRQGLERKMERYGIDYSSTGTGDNRVYTILTIPDPLRVYFVFDLNLDPRSDFTKARDYLYYCLNDEEFSKMPFEVQERRIREIGLNISRQTMSRIFHWLEQKGYLYIDKANSVYYFANKNEQIFTDEATYKKAWREYWERKRERKFLTVEAIDLMRFEYGGVARMQGAISVNGVYKSEMDLLNQLIIRSLLSEKNF
ncbi:MAG: hypothetical protein IKW92_00770 [Firmicutes bacterium]|nr:hypothetical protein [Bacillota bacterium]